MTINGNIRTFKAISQLSRRSYSYQYNTYILIFDPKLPSHPPTPTNLHIPQSCSFLYSQISSPPPTFPSSLSSICFPLYSLFQLPSLTQPLLIRYQEFHWLGFFSPLFPSLSPPSLPHPLPHLPSSSRSLHVVSLYFIYIHIWARG